MSKPHQELFCIHCAKACGVLEKEKNHHFSRCCCSRVLYIQYTVILMLFPIDVSYRRDSLFEVSLLCCSPFAHAETDGSSDVQLYCISSIG